MQYAYLSLEAYEEHPEIRAQRALESGGSIPYTLEEPDAWTTDPGRHRNRYDDEEATHLRVERSWAEGHPALELEE